MLFAGLVTLVDGKADITVVPGDEPADYEVEVTTFAGLDWTRRNLRFRANQPVSVALHVPPIMHRQEVAEGRVHVQAPGPFRLTVRHDGVAVNVEKDRFPITVGDWEAEVVCLNSGQRHLVQRRIEPAGRFATVAHSLRWVEGGQTVRRQPHEIEMRVHEPAALQPRTHLAWVTANYEHCCCEQTAARLLAWSVVYRCDPERRRQAATAILAGVARQQRMFLPKRGFKGYPEWSDEPSPWGERAAHHLLILNLDAAEPEVQAAIALARGMGEDAAQAYGLAWPPVSTTDPWDAWHCWRAKRSPGALRSARRNARVLGKGRLDVWQRAQACWTAATLLTSGEAADTSRGLQLANAALATLQDGRLYSTWDSAAALDMMDALHNMQCEPAEVQHDEDVIHVRRGRALIETLWNDVCDWDDLTPSIRVQASFAPTLQAGQGGCLTVQLEDGYEFGDLLWIQLPPAVSRVEGGGQLKRFSVDCAGRSRVTIPLAATGLTPYGPQRLQVCLRNMYDEARIGRPADLFVEVIAAPPAETAVAEVVDLKPSRNDDWMALAWEHHMDAPVARLARMILSTAREQQATEIYIEPGRILYRVDDVLEDVMSPPRYIHNAVVLHLMTLFGISAGQWRGKTSDPVPMRLETFATGWSRRAVIYVGGSE